VVAARVAEHVEFFVFQLHEPSAKRLGETHGSRAVPGIMAVVVSLHIVKEREVLDNPRVRSVDGSQPKTVAADAGPVTRAMDAVPVESELVADQPDEVRRDDARLTVRHSRS